MTYLHHSHDIEFKPYDVLVDSRGGEWTLSASGAWFGENGVNYIDVELLFRSHGPMTLNPETKPSSYVV